MKNPLQENIPKNTCQWPTERVMQESNHNGRNGSDKRLPECCSSVEHRATEPPDNRSVWLPVSLVAMVIICLVMAAWVWFEILWM